MKTDDRSHLIHSSDNTNTYDHNVIMSSYGMEYDDTIRDGWTDGRMRMIVRLCTCMYVFYSSVMNDEPFLHGYQYV
jgi:hypothetical protein